MVNIISHQLQSRKGITLIEVMIGLALLALLMMAAYRLFFSEVKAIRLALEHIGVNENTRAFLSQFGHDVRTASKVTFPWPIRREDVRTLAPAGEGIICSLEKQSFDFSIKPPDPKFLRRIKIDWRLKKNSDGTFDLYRDIVSDIPPKPGLPSPFKASRKICGGVKEITVFTTLRKPPKICSFGGLPFKNFIEFEPYYLDGNGPFLVHVRAVFVREGTRASEIKEQSAQKIRTCFAVRGRPNGVNP